MLTAATRRPRYAARFDGGDRLRIAGRAGRLRLKLEGVVAFRLDFDRSSGDLDPSSADIDYRRFTYVRGTPGRSADSRGSRSSVHRASPIEQQRRYHSFGVSGPFEGDQQSQYRWDH
jgi:hypothetical protein